MSRFPKVTMEEMRNYPKTEITEQMKGSPLLEIFNRPLADVSEEQLDALNGEPCNPQLAMPIEKRSNLFLPGDQSVEIGYCQMPDGTGFVANRTFFPNATPEMFDWWFTWHPLEDVRLAMWLPNAHLSCYVRDPYVMSDDSGISLKTRNWNKEHYPSEGMMSLEEGGYVCIRFFAPEEFGLDMHKVLASPVQSFASATVLFFGESLDMFGEEMANKVRAEDPDAKVPFNCFLHTVRPVVGGCELRSRFWLGKGMNAGVPYTVPMPEGTDFEAVAWAMLRHTIQEMSNLASFLPEVYNMYEGKVDIPKN